MAQPIVHHRSPDFRPVYRECLDRLKEVYRTQNEVLLYTASGTAGLESVVANLTSPGERVVVVSAGYFGERWADIARAYGCEVDHVRYEWGETPSPDDLAARLSETGGATAVLVTQSETSTGVVADVRAFAGAAKEAGALIAVDAISSLGAVPCDTDGWELDAVVSGSQKALMAPPGLCMVSVSDEAWEVRERAAASRFYLDWERTRVAQETLDAAFTPAVSIVIGLNVALGLILEQGLEAAFERHVRLGRACREGVKAMGLELLSPDDDSSAVVTAVRVPEPVDGNQFLLDLRDRMGITLAPGQGPLKGKAFRIGHIGWFDVFDITTALAGSSSRSPKQAPTSSAESLSRARSRHTSTSPRESPRPRADRRRGDRAPQGPVRRGRGRERRPRREDRRLRRDRHPIGDEARRGPDRAGRSAEGDRARRRGGRQCRRRGRHAPRHRRRECARVDGHLGRGAHRRAPARALQEHPAGARGAQGGPLGALSLRGSRAGRKDARRARVRTYRPAGGQARKRARDARRRVRPVRREGALPRARCRTSRDAGRGPRQGGLRDASSSAHRGDARLDRRVRVREDARRGPDRQRRARRAARRGRARRRASLRQGGRSRARRLLRRAVLRAAPRAGQRRRHPASGRLDRGSPGPSGDDRRRAGRCSPRRRPCHERGQHPIDRRGGPRGAGAVHPARGEPWASGDGARRRARRAHRARLLRCAVRVRHAPAHGRGAERSLPGPSRPAGQLRERAA